MLTSTGLELLFGMGESIIFISQPSTIHPEQGRSQARTPRVVVPETAHLWGKEDSPSDRREPEHP